MRYKFFISLLLLLFSTELFAQQPDSKHIRIVDTLTVPEKTNRYPIILKSEMDSLIKLFTVSQPQQIINVPVKEDIRDINLYLLTGLLTIIALLGLVIYLFFRQLRKINQTITHLNEYQTDAVFGNRIPTITKDKKGKTPHHSLENKINELTAELYKLSKEKEGLNQVIKEYNGIQFEYDSLRQGILKAYKVKNYPGYDKTKDESLAMHGVLQTENSVAVYAYENFLKPILAITDANKNSPAKLSEGDQEKVVNLLVSLSFLYIEYLYLRVNDLSIGGKMVERIHGLSKGNGLDATLLKKLNTEFGSRALVIKIALNKAGLHQLSYPVFDETNLNNQ